MTVGQRVDLDVGLDVDQDWGFRHGFRFGLSSRFGFGIFSYTYLDFGLVVGLELVV